MWYQYSVTIPKVTPLIRALIFSMLTICWNPLLANFWPSKIWISYAKCKLLVWNVTIAQVTCNIFIGSRGFFCYIFKPGLSSRPHDTGLITSVVGSLVVVFHSSLGTSVATFFVLNSEEICFWNVNCWLNGCPFYKFSLLSHSTVWISKRCRLLISFECHILLHPKTLKDVKNKFIEPIYLSYRLAEPIYLSLL